MKNLLHGGFSLARHSVKNAHDLDVNGNDGLGNQRCKGLSFRARARFVCRNDATDSSTKLGNFLVAYVRGVDRNFVGIFHHTTAVGLVKGNHFCHSLLCLLITQKGFGKVGTGILFVFFNSGEEQAALDEHQFARHNDEFTRDLHIHILRRLEVFKVLVADERDGNIDNIHFVLLNQHQKQVKGTFELIQSVSDCGFHKVR